MCLDWKFSDVNASREINFLLRWNCLLTSQQIEREYPQCFKYYLDVYIYLGINLFI